MKKRVVTSQGFRSADGALNSIAGYEAMNIIRKGQVRWLPKGAFSASPPEIYLAQVQTVLPALSTARYRYNRTHTTRVRGGETSPLKGGSAP